MVSHDLPTATGMRPILLNSCALAATTAEAKFRIDAPITPSRGARVIALDARAAEVLSAIVGQQNGNTRFYRTAGPERLHAIAADPAGAHGEPPLYALDPELDGIDLAVMVATTPDGAQEAAAIGSACHRRQVMTAGVALATEEDLATLAILRPYARVLLVSNDGDDVPALLTALRA